MADLMDQPIGSEGSNFDNDFEKVDPPRGTVEDSVSSSTGHDFFSTPAPAVQPTVGASSSDAATAPLLSFDPLGPDPPAPVRMPEAVPKPDSSSMKEPLKPEAPPAQPEKKAAPSTGGESWLKNIDPRGPVDNIPSSVIDLIYWRDVKKTGIVFGSMLVLLLSLALFSVLSVVAYLALAALTVTTSFCIYKKVLGAVQKTGEGHPFKAYLDKDVSIPKDKVNQMADHVEKHLSANMRELRRLFLVEDLVDSLKFGLLLWVLTYIGSWFNGMTLIILAVISIFTIPKFYETYKTQIDQYFDLARTQVKNVLKQIQEKIPLPGKKKQQ